MKVTSTKRVFITYLNVSREALSLSAISSQNKLEGATAMNVQPTLSKHINTSAAKPIDINS